jgi:hypothetical protein
MYYIRLSDDYAPASSRWLLLLLLLVCCAQPLLPDLTQSQVQLSAARLDS